MGAITKIQWADRSFSPWIGCAKKSPGCKNCYAEFTTRARVLRSQGHETWGKGKPRSRTSEAMWNQVRTWDRQHADFQEVTLADGTVHRGTFREMRKAGVELMEAIESREVRQRVFPSLCDPLDDEVPIEWFADYLRLIDGTPNLDHLVLTKRPENWRPRLEAVMAWIQQTHGDTGPWAGFCVMLDRWVRGIDVPANVWMGASVEDQERAVERIPLLLGIPAVVRFLSVEPLLEKVDLAMSHCHPCNPGDPSSCPDHERCGCRLDWVIVGGESGPGARACNVDWIRSVVLQCRAAGVPVFVKQLGARPLVMWPLAGNDGAPGLLEVGKDISFTAPRGTAPFKCKKGGVMEEWPEDLRAREFPKEQQPIKP